MSKLNEDRKLPKASETKFAIENLSSRTSTSLCNDVLAYRLTIKECETFCKTSIQRGLSSSRVGELLQQYGSNSLGGESKISYSSILIHQACNAMILVLFISMVIALAIRDWISGGVIAFVVFINVFVGAIQEYKAERTMGSLRSLSSPTARVIRNGDDATIPAEELVPGDICVIETGDTIPADLRLVDSMNLETDEALLTGESMPVSKVHQETYKDYSVPIPVGDRLNMAFSSSVVSKGRGKGIAVATGLNTEIGAIAKSLQGDKTLIRRVDKSDLDNPPRKRDYSKAILGTMKDIVGSFLGTTTGTPLQKKLSFLAIILFFVAVLFAIVVMASQKFNVNREVAIYAICVALSMIPSSLIVVLTITMAIGTKVMVEKNVIVRKLDSLESLGGINDICSDKTGTLTQGKMIVKLVWIPSIGTYSVQGSTEPFNPEVGCVELLTESPFMQSKNDDCDDERSEEINTNEKNIIDDATTHSPKFTQWLNAASMANIASVGQMRDEKTGNMEWKAHGDPTEIAIQVFTNRLGFSRAKLSNEVDREYEHMAEFPFDSSIKRMTTIYKSTKDNSINIFTKGAVEKVLACCDFWYGESNSNETPIPLTNHDKLTIEQNMDALSSQGLRVLSFASRHTKDGNVGLSERESIESGLTFLGLSGIYDPPREETLDSVRRCHRAGINVHMLTGDHPGTAKTIAQAVGILPNNLYHYADDVVRAMIMTANEFDSLADEDIDKLPVLPLVIARCAPQTKVRMIDALHRRKLYCAMTGDGVNDSPSLKKADIGIAMGLNGSDVAKDASDIVLSDDNFASILNAIEEGRRMSSNIQKFVLQLLAENVAQAIYLMVGLVFIDSNGFSVFPLSPVEVLWILVVTSCFPAMGLGQEAAADDCLINPPNSNIFTLEVIVDMMVYGVWMAACCLVCFVIVIYGKGNGNLGSDCNEKFSSSCHYVFRARSTSFATMTWCALLLALECINMRKSLFKMRSNSSNKYTQVFTDLWSNQFLLWSVLYGFISVFPIIYIPVINDKVFLHKPIDYEWGLVLAFSVLFLLGAELYKWLKRVYLRKKGIMTSAHNPEHDLEKVNPFEKYSSFSRAATFNE